MKIQKILVTDIEVEQALQEWLQRRGLYLTVTGFSKNYGGVGGYEIENEINEPVTDTLPPVKPNIVEQILAPIPTPTRPQVAVIGKPLDGQQASSPTMNTPIVKECQHVYGENSTVCTICGV